MPPVSFADLRALARAATLIENRRPEAEPLLEELFPHTGRALHVGITGSPGAGKSTLVNQLIRALRRDGQRVAVIAVDPSSAWTGGAILGDRVRMQDHHDDPRVFIRSMATRGHLGGLAAVTAEMAMLFDGAGADTVVIETVGVGQDEVEIARLADVTAVVLVPGMGDEVQAIKAGIMEIADVFVINKADRPGAEQLEREIRASGKEVPVLRTVATEGIGIDELVGALRGARAAADQESRRVERWRHRLLEMLRERLLERLPPASLERAAAEVAAGVRTPHESVASLLKEIL